MASTVEAIRRAASDSAATAGPAVQRVRSLLKRWLAAVAFVAGALGLSLVLRPFIEQTIFVFFFFAITLTAWYSGLVPGLAVTIVALLSTNYFLVEPYGAFRFNESTLIMFVTLGGTAAFISWLTDTLTETREMLADQADTLEAQARELELQMQESQMLTEELAIANTELEESVTRAQAASRAKTDFLAVMSHELRTPLNAIVGYSDLLQTGVSGPLTETQKTHLSRIRSSSFHLLDLIQDVLSFSRIEAGREELRIGDVNVQQLVREVNSYVEQQSVSKGVEQRLVLPPDPIVMITDPAKVKQILLNLLNNASKFTDSGSIVLEVRRDDDDVIFKVVDTGPGIAREHLELIFEPFTQVDQSMTRQKGGAGLGLPVSRRLAHLLGGELLVESVPGDGSTFTLRLPVHARLH